MSNPTVARLLIERTYWRKNQPFGFIARPQKNLDGTLNLMEWGCAIPGKVNTAWAGGLYYLNLIFCENYPIEPPTCIFNPPIFHPNVYVSGVICTSILCRDDDWLPDMRIKQILLCIQDLLDEPNLENPANFEAANLYEEDKLEYDNKIEEQADSNSS